MDLLTLATEDLIEYARDKGFTFDIVNGDLKVEGPTEHAEIAAEIGRRKSEVMEWRKKSTLMTHDESENWNATNGGPAVLHCTSKPEVQLPGGAVTITSSAGQFAGLLAATGKYFSRNGTSPMRLSQQNGEPWLEPLKAAALCSDLESVATISKEVPTKNGSIKVPATCSEPMARLILGAVSFRDALPPIHVMSQCPVLVERGNELVVISTYDRETGILATGSHIEVPLSEAVKLLFEVIKGFNFATPGDRARALASIITPAMLFGRLLGGRAPIDLTEADKSQAGKGYRNKLTCAIYGYLPRVVTQRSGGVGSLQETFDATLIAGASIVTFDNLRLAGRLDVPAIESFMTEDTYFARVPYASPVPIDPRRILIMMTSNAVSVTPDLANRCSCVRIMKHPPGHAFQKYAEGDLLDHVLAHRSMFLGAVFAIIREWHRRGKPELQNVDHDFRKWGRVLGYIVQHIVQGGELLGDHRAAQERIASPLLSWVRDVALTVQRADRFDEWMRPHQLLTLLDSAGFEGLGVDGDDEEQWRKATQNLGRKLSKAFQAEDQVVIDAIQVKRREEDDDQGRQKREYAFFSITPNNPQCAPNENTVFPNTPDTPEHFNKTRTHARAHIKDLDPIGDIGGHWGETHDDSTGSSSSSHSGGNGKAGKCNHTDPATWVRRDGAAHCAGCDRFMGRLPEATS